MRIGSISAVQFSGKTLVELIDIKAELVGACKLEKFNLKMFSISICPKPENIPHSNPT